jgi:hypothetical protein
MVPVVFDSKRCLGFSGRGGVGWGVVNSRSVEKERRSFNSTISPQAGSRDSAVGYCPTFHPPLSKYYYTYDLTRTSL